MRGKRAVSDVVGVVLLVATVLIGVTVVAGAGAVALGDRTDELAGETATTDLRGVAEAAERVTSGGTDRRVAALTGATGGDQPTVVERGRLRVAVGNRSAGWSTALSAPLGALVVRGDAGTVGYQGGGVWRADAGRPATTETIRPPPVSVVTDDATTVSLSAVLLRDETTLPGDAEVVLRDQRPLYDRLYVPRVEAVRIVVESQFASGWADSFERAFPGSATVRRPDATTVVVTYGRGTKLYLHGTVSEVSVEAP